MCTRGEFRPGELFSSGLFSCRLDAPWQPLAAATERTRRLMMPPGGLLPPGGSSLGPAVYYADFRSLLAGLLVAVLIAIVLDWHIRRWHGAG